MQDKGEMLLVIDIKGYRSKGAIGSRRKGGGGSANLRV
tara:strand:- start:688 stop:801 length:114 start_codon:yes stop_codon:yes gene_type:complete